MTRAQGLLLTLLIFTAGCGGKSTTAPTPSGSTIVFTAQLSPANEVPAIGNADASGSGTATITVTATKDASGTITAATVLFQVNLTNFPANTTLTGAHIHDAPAGANSGVKINTTLTSGEIVLGNGTGGFTKVVNGAPVDIVQGMINNPAGYYFNVHTTLNGGGAARGQLVKQ